MNIKWISFNGLGAYYAYQQNIEVIAIRIGAFQYQQDYSQLSSRDLSAWSEPVDVCSLLINSIETDLNDEPFVIAHGISNNRFKRLDITCLLYTSDAADE